MNPEVSVIICTYNRFSMLGDALSSVGKMRIPDGCTCEIVVVDNNSRDQTREVVETFASASTMRTRYVFEPRQGKTIALNTGIAAAAGEILLFTDDDVEVSKDWLASYVKALNCNDCLGAGGRIVPSWECRKPFWAQPDERYRFMAVFGQFDLGPSAAVLKTTPFGANMAIRKCAFERYGGFREDLGVRGGKRELGEEGEFFRRVSDAGERWIYVPDAVVRHRVTAHQASLRYLENYYGARGRYEMLRERHSELYWFGVPRSRLRRFLESAARWFFSLNRRRRLYYWLDLHFQIGSIQQAYVMRNSGRTR